MNDTPAKDKKNSAVVIPRVDARRNEANDGKGRGVFQEENGLSIKKLTTACFLKHFIDKTWMNAQEIHARHSFAAKGNY